MSCNRIQYIQSDRSTHEVRQVTCEVSQYMQSDKSKMRSGSLMCGQVSHQVSDGETMVMFLVHLGCSGNTTCSADM